MATYVGTARDLATQAHAGQVDKAGRPYIEHPARVAAAVARLGPEYEAAAWLHDVVEDTDLTLGDIRQQMRLAGTPLPWDVSLAIDALTKRPGEPYADAVWRACASPIARAVKFADNLDNSAEERLALLDAKTASRLRRKYAAARVQLEQTEEVGRA